MLGTRWGRGGGQLACSAVRRLERHRDLGHANTSHTRACLDRTAGVTDTGTVKGSTRHQPFESLETIHEAEVDAGTGSTNEQHVDGAVDEPVEAVGVDVCSNRTLSFIHGDMLRLDISDATVVYMASTMFSNDLMSAVIKRLSGLAPGARIASLQASL